MVHYVNVVFFLRELGFIWILVVDAQNSQRVLLALSVLSEDRGVQRSIEVVVHGWDVDPAIGKHQHHTKSMTHRPQLLHHGGQI